MQTISTRAAARRRTDRWPRSPGRCSGRRRTARRGPLPGGGAPPTPRRLGRFIRIADAGLEDLVRTAPGAFSVSTHSARSLEWLDFARPPRGPTGGGRRRLPPRARALRPRRGRRRTGDSASASGRPARRRPTRPRARSRPGLARHHLRRTVPGGEHGASGVAVDPEVVEIDQPGSCARLAPRRRRCRATGHRRSSPARAAPLSASPTWASNRRRRRNPAGLEVTRPRWILACGGASSLRAAPCPRGTPPRSRRRARAGARGGRATWRPRRSAA